MTVTTTERHDEEDDGLRLDAELLADFRDSEACGLLARITEIGRYVQAAIVRPEDQHDHQVIRSLWANYINAVREGVYDSFKWATEPDRFAFSLEGDPAPASWDRWVNRTMQAVRVLIRWLARAVHYDEAALTGLIHIEEAYDDLLKDIARHGRDDPPC